MFVHLHTHSYYSFLEGLASPQALAAAAARLEMPALALTDHTGMSGAVEFYDACRREGLEPILGLELDIRPHPSLEAASERASGKLVLLASDHEGWKNLCRLSSAVLADENGVRPAGFDLLAEHARGLICLTGGQDGLCSQMLRAGKSAGVETWLSILREIFADRLYVELTLHAASDPGLSRGLALLAARLRLPCAAAHEVFYLEPEQSDLQRTVSAIRRLQPRVQLPEASLAPQDAWLIPPGLIAERFTDYPQAVSNTREIADRCRLDLPLGKTRFPLPDLPPGTTPAAELRARVRRGAEARYASQNAGVNSLPEEIEARLEHELQTIEALGFEPLFLIMEQIVAFAQQSGIPIASRGSASSSLAAHCLGITTPDPVRLNLYFERFLNPARATPPDIDTDLCSRRRDEVIEFVYQRFGADRTAMVGTVNRFRRRSALRETAKAFGLSAGEVSALIGRLPQRWYGPPERIAAPESPYAELQPAFPQPRYAAIFEHAEALIGTPRHLSIHPGGMVIAPVSLTEIAPVQRAAKGVIITQFDLDSIERTGLVKIDLLGIRGLTVLGDVAHNLQTDATPPKNKNTRPALLRSAVAVLDSIPADDDLTSALIAEARTIGCFQIESPGMRATLREIRARTVDDLMAALALYRPGPLTGGLKHAFVARHRGLEPTAYLHPALEPLLSDTYGVILYQEQVLRIAHELAGLSLADADLLRRAMSHFDPGKQMVTLKERFLKGAWENHRVPLEAGEQVWQMMAAFAGYGFPKAHAASYAWVAWKSAWCKAHHPAIFLAAVLANWGGFYSQRIYLTEARRMGLNVRPPDVNYAEAEFSVRYRQSLPVLYMGLNQVRELTRRTRDQILKERPFASARDFLARADPRPQEADHLIRAGCLESLGAIPNLLHLSTAGRSRRGQLPLFELAENAEADWTIEQKTAAQEAILGVSIDAHPLELAAGQIAESGALSIVDAAGMVGKPVRVAGTRQTWRRSRAQRGDYIYFMTLEDLEGMIEVVIHAEVYARCRAAFRAPGPYLVDGVVEYDRERGEPFIRAGTIESLQP